MEEKPDSIKGVLDTTRLATHTNSIALLALDFWQMLGLTSGY